jgi:hypothetical protein
MVVNLILKKLHILLCPKFLKIFIDIHKIGVKVDNRTTLVKTSPLPMYINYKPSTYGVITYFSTCLLLSNGLIQGEIEY